MSARTIRERLDEMVATLRADPRVTVFAYEVRPPASADALALAESRLGQALSEDLRAFYAAHDGVFLEWGLRDAAHASHVTPFDFPPDECPQGCINLLPVGSAIATRWQEESHVNEIDGDLQERLFGAPLLPGPPIQACVIDNFSTWAIAALVVGPEPRIVIATDHGADVSSSHDVSFATYLDLVLASWGSRTRTNALAVPWSRTPARLEAWTRTTTLDEIVEAMRASQK